MGAEAEVRISSEWPSKSVPVLRLEAAQQAPVLLAVTGTRGRAGRKEEGGPSAGPKPAFPESSTKAPALITRA